MAVDLSIQVFSYELFDTFFFDHGLIPRKSLPKDIYDTVYSGYKGETHANADIVHAVYCRQAIFHDVYRLQFEYTDMAYCDSPSDFIAFMCLTFSSEEFQELKVFEHIFATCAFVMEMCLNSYYKNNNLYIGDAYLCWAMYFDTELKSDFYEKGGWDVLKSVARSYTPPFAVIKSCMDLENMDHHMNLMHTVPLHKLAAAMEDFYNFQTFSDAGENLTRAKTWVNFHVHDRNSPKSNRSKFNVKTIDGLEHFLRCLKFLCDPLGDMVLDFDSSIQMEKVSNFPINRDLTKHFMKVYDCKTNSFSKPISSSTVVPEPIEFSKTIESLTDAVHALTLELQAIEQQNILNSGAPVGNKIHKDNFYDYLGRGILSVYDLLQDSLDVDDLKTALSHAPVFMGEKYRIERSIKANVALDPISQARKNQRIVQNEKCQSPTPITCQTIFDGTKSKKKKKRTNFGHENAPVVHSANNIGDASENKVYSDDTKDILKMVLVLGCQPGYSYVLSTLKKSAKVTSS